MDNDLTAAALTRATAFADTLYDGDLIHEESGFTVDDLRVIIAALEPVTTAPSTVEDAIQDKLGDLA
jgi:hypothetical protein